MRRGENTFHKGLWELKIVNPFSWLRYVAGVWVMEGVGNTHNCLVPGQSMTCRNSEMMQSDMQPHWQRYSKTDYRFVFLCSRTRCTNPMKLPHWWSHLCSDLCSPWLLNDMRRLWKGKSINQRSFTCLFGKNEPMCFWRICCHHTALYHLSVCSQTLL